MSATTTTTTTTDGTPEQQRAPATAAAAVRVVPVGSPALRSAWAAFAAQTPGKTPFHHPHWCDSVESAFGHRALHRLALRDGQPTGVLPLFAVRCPLAGTLLVSVPYATYGGILSADEASRLALAREAVRLAERHEARLLELRSAQPVLADWPVDERYVTFVRPLPAHVSQLLNYLPRKARAAVRQASHRERLSVTHEAGQLRTVWQLYARSMRRLASLNYPWRFFATLAERFGPEAWVTVVHRDGRPVAGLLSFVFGETVYPYFAGVDERVRYTGTTNLLYFAVMQRAVEAGLRWFDFGRSRRDNLGAVRFKQHQGFAPTPLGYQRYLPAGRRPIDLSPSNPRFALTRRLWPHLPLWLTRPLGSRLSRWIPG